MLQMEIPLFLIFFTFTLSEPVFTNLLIYRTCYVTLGYNKSECALLGSKNASENTTELERIVQPHANFISMTQNVLGCMIVSVVCLFFGPWSDKHGRKPVFFICILGFMLNNLLCTILSYFEYTSPWLFLLGLMFSFAGGFASFLSVAFSYVTDVTSEENRGSRMGTVEAAIVLGSLVGSISCSYLLDAVDYYCSFGICALVAFVAVVYTIFFLPESVDVTSSDGRFLDLFTTNHIKDMLHVIFKPRDKNRRAILLLTLTLMGISVFMIYDSGVLFFYLRRAFAWSLEKYTIYQAISQALWIIGTIFMVHVLHKLMDIPETVLLLCGFLSLLDAYLVYGLASRSWHIYAAGCVKMLGGGVSPLARTLLSKVVEPDEAGKVFSFILPIETIMGTVIYPIYTLVYNATIETLPSAYNFVIAGIIGVDLVMVMAVMYLQRKKHGVHYLLHEDVNA